MNDVLKVDSINHSHSDFIATHVPLRNITVNTNVGGKEIMSSVSEDKLFYEIFEDETVSNKHQFIIVEGSSGAGKSHFIRWINAKLHMKSESGDVVLMIRRSDNTLKGTIRQLIDIDEVKQIANKEAYERLVKANQTISEQKFKSTIYHRFIVEIENESRESSDELNILSPIKRKRLLALLKNDFFTERMLENGGPIERIFRKITAADSRVDLETVAKFEDADFTLSIDFVEEMDDAGADRNALTMANRLTEYEEENEEIAEITQYMNSFVEEVIQASAGIEPGDFQQIFKEIRQELRKQNKNLILLIEDITAFTGINQELLNALVVEHTGMNEKDKLCRLISVVGTTGEYYRLFRSNYKDRITRQITIKDGIIGEHKEDLIQFVARYLNAVSLESEILEEWVRNGANRADIPIHHDTNGEKWGYYDFDHHRRVSLYPFTRNAIINLYAAMPRQKTPRYILQDIVEKAVNEILFRKEFYPMFCLEWRTGSSETLEKRISNIVGATDIENKSEYYNRLMKFVGFWSNGTIDLTEDDCIGAIPSTVYEDLGFSVFAKYIKANSQVTEKRTEEIRSEKPSLNSSVEIKSTDGKYREREKEYESFKKNVMEWHYDKKNLLNFQKVRDDICKFIFDSVNWQQAEIPNISRKTVEDSGMKLIFFERQEQGKNKSLLMLEDTEDNYQVLLAFGKWRYLGNGSWDFPDSASAVFTVTSWLERNKKTFAEVIRGSRVNSIPYYVKAAMWVQVYKLILNDKFEGTTSVRIGRNVFLRRSTPKNPNVIDSKGHTKVWKDLLTMIYQNDKLNNDCYVISKEYFNLVQGNTVEPKIFVLNYSLLRRALKEIKSFSEEVTDNAEHIPDNKIKEKREIIAFYNKIVAKAKEVAEKEREQAKAVMQSVLSCFGYDEDDEIEEEDLRAMIEDIDKFYSSALSSGVNISYRSDIHKILEKIKKNSESYCRCLKQLQTDYTDYSDIDVLIAFSKNPMGKIWLLLQILKEAEENSSKIIRQKENEINHLQTSQHHTDIRFQEKKSDFMQLYEKFRGI